MFTLNPPRSIRKQCSSETKCTDSSSSSDFTHLPHNESILTSPGLSLLIPGLKQLLSDMINTQSSEYGAKLCKAQLDISIIIELQDFSYRISFPFCLSKDCSWKVADNIVDILAIDSGLSIYVGSLIEEKLKEHDKLLYGGSKLELYPVSSDSEVEGEDSDTLIPLYYA